jgi:exopolyphosphatase / guanosine-5'-triphosphate,3'-diphosphate pyrophosphatase
MTTRVAIIDMGTNTFHLLIADDIDGKHTMLYREKRAVKIGMAGINEGFITEAGAERALEAIRHFKRIIDTYRTRQILAFGTSALRNARNGEEIIGRIKELGIDAQIISGEREAELIYLGVRSALNLGVSKSLIIDIGGGSVEFIIANQEQVFWKQSIEIGAQRLLEKFHRHDPILPEEIKMLDSYFQESLRPVLDMLEQHQPQTLVGSSGTFDTLSDIHCIRYEITKEADDSETPLTLDGIMEIYHDLIIKDRMERLLTPGMIEMRVDMIVVACCLIRFIIQQYSFDKVRVSTYALKEGILASLRA